MMSRGRALPRANSLYIHRAIAGEKGKQHTHREGAAPLLSQLCVLRDELFQDHVLQRLGDAVDGGRVADLVGGVERRSEVVHLFGLAKRRGARVLRDHLQSSKQGASRESVEIPSRICDRRTFVYLRWVANASLNGLSLTKSPCSVSRPRTCGEFGTTNSK